MQYVGLGTTLIVTGERKKKVLGVVEQMRAEAGDTLDVCLLFFIIIYREDENSGEQHLSVGGILRPLSLQPGSGDPYSKKGNSLKKSDCFEFGSRL